MNPVLFGVIFLCVLCLFKINVLVAMLLAMIVSGTLGGIPLVTVELESGEEVYGIMSYLTDGFTRNGETALAYILLGTLATALADIGLAEILGTKVTKMMGKKPIALILSLAGIACFSQNLVPIHIAFIPIIIPPLLSLLSELKIDRRAVACSLAFGLKAPYIAIPFGFGLTYQNIVADNLSLNGMKVTQSDVASVNWLLAVCMFIGLLFAIFVTYRKPRDYKITLTESQVTTTEKLSSQHYITIFALFLMVLLQLYFKSLALSSLGCLVFMLLGGAIKVENLDSLVQGGVKLMGFIAFVMLVSGGFAGVMTATGGVESLVDSAVDLMGGNKVIAAIVMTGVGLLVTMGIGSSFSTIPILAVIFVPLCERLNFSPSATILLVSAAAALGDAGSPASDTTLGPTSGLNADGQHDHIRDTCIPTFLHFNIPLIVGAVVFSLLLS